ncbi:uncharacterized protein C6orf132 homolog [Xenopus laevis]|uniref:Uncharacterized protein C6orf132 homolog n=2 Tax=Xenopus laevis TaxID=8355 RepID=A0A1L8H663_XENLA|nr:uncharacterized protein C6orf132 homolog [Xenopus laevis]OCT91575.1 hypothetical protein XELAEV_18014634mg [Xenopus laevis]
MKKGTLNKLFGKKNANNNSLYAENPPWMLPQGNMKSSADYHDMPSSYSFLDDSGSATLKARPGPRIRPLLPVSTNSMAVPTPSVPEVFVEHHPIENGLNLNGHYRMYSSIGDLRGNMHYDDYPEEIPAPPSMPPPPPPNMPPPDPPHESPLSPSESCPGTPSPPDLIPPTPNSTALSVPNFVPPPPPLLSNQQLQSASKWKSETVLNNLPNDLPVGLPNRISLNPSIFQPSHGQTNSNMDPNSSLPRLFKVPPPAPTRTSSIQLQEYIDQQTDNTRYTKDPPPSPMQSSFNPTMQAKLFSTGREQSSLNDILNKRKSMIIMDTPSEAKSMETSHTIEIASAINTNTESYGLTDLKAKMDVSLPGKTESGNNKVNSNSADQENTALNTSKEHCFRENPEKQTSKVRQINNDFASTMSGKNSVKEGSKAFEDRTALKKDSYVSEMSKSSKPTVNIISLKLILGENQKLFNTNPHSKKDEDIQKPLDAMAGGSNTEPVKVIKTPLSPPPVAPPPPPIVVPSNPPSVPPAPPLPAALTTAPISLTTSSPLLLSKKASATNLHPPPPPPPPPPAPQPTGSQSSPKAATLSASPVLPSMAPPQPPKAPPAPPPLPPFATSSVQISPSTPPKILHIKDDTFKEIHSKHISAETRHTQPSFINTDNDQKINVGKIKQELEALLSSPVKEDLKVGSLKQFQHGPESPKKTPNDKVASLRGGENTLVNSLMMKVPLLPKQPVVEDTDTDTSEWLPKNNMTDIKIPEPDYLPASSQPIYNYKQPASYTMTKKITVESAPHPMTEEITVESAPHSITKEIIVELTPHPMIKEITVESAPLPTKSSDELNTGETLIPSYKPHHARRVSAGSWTTVPVSSVPSKSEPVLSLKADTDQEPKEASPPLASLVKSTLSLRENESAFNHPVTGEKVDECSPMALLMAAKKRAQKGSRSIERSNLPKVSVSNGVVLSSLTSHNSDINNPKTFVVVPRDETTQQALLKGSSSYLNDSGTVSFLGSSTDKYENNLEWIDQGQPKPTVSIQMFDSQHPSEDNTRRWSILNSSSTNKIQDSLSPQIKVIHPIAKNNISPKVEKFNISSFPSSSPVLGTNDEMGYKMIPPPAQFMNNPTVPNMSIHNTEQKERSFIYGNNIISDYSKPSYEQNYKSNQTIISQTINSRDRYLDDHSITGLSRDSHKGSLIKKRLYMPEPETSINYGKTSTLRSAALPTPYSHRLPQTSPTMVFDPRRTNSTTRYLAQGRRVSTENLIRAVPSQSDMKYNAQNPEYPASRPSRPQTSYQGLTFSVRPGTRQPISNTYQGGYL